MVAPAWSLPPQLARREASATGAANWTAWVIVTLRSRGFRLHRRSVRSAEAVRGLDAILAHVGRGRCIEQVPRRERLDPLAARRQFRAAMQLDTERGPADTADHRAPPLA